MLNETLRRKNFEIECDTDNIEFHNSLTGWLLELHILLCMYDVDGHVCCHCALSRSGENK